MPTDEKREINIRIFPIYKMFAWDLLFYYAISFIFLTRVKGFSASDVILMEVSLYTLCKCFFQIPGTIIVDKVRKKKKYSFCK